MYLTNTKISAILLFFLFYVNAYGQLTLEDIFLTNKYATKQVDDIEFLHTKSAFAKITAHNNSKFISFYNDKNALIDEWKIAANNTKNFSDLIISNQDNYFLVNNYCEQLYRRSQLCNYFYGDKSGNLISLSDSKQIYPTFSPDDSKIAFIKNNNLFYKEIATNTEIQITHDGEWNKIINGKSDWVYEEELELTRVYEWNATGNKIAYLKFDESNVREYTIPLYYDMQYPNYFTYKYPKVGEENAKVSVWLYDVKSKKNKQILLPFSYEYIPRIYWNATGNEIIAMLLNRQQDTLQLIAYNVDTKKTRQLYLEIDSTYIDIPKTVQFLSDNSFILTSEKDGFNHIYHYDKDGKLLKQLTKGNFEVKDVYGIDEKNNLVYFQSNEEINSSISTNRNLFQINYKTLDKKQLYNTTAGATSAKFSPDFSYYFRTFSNIKIPPITHLVSTQINNVILLENNQFLVDSLLPILPKKYIGGILSKNGNLNTYNLLPNDSIFHLSATIPQPTLFYVYGGPGNEEVVNEWNSKSTNLFLYYLAQQGIEVICIDPRGSGGKGAAFKKSTFLHLGKQETEDILDYANFLKGNRSIDSMRFGIFGTSYGGYLASNCLLEGNGIFKTSIAFAPITNWFLYNTIYTERYMRTPIENPIGYFNSCLNNKANNLYGNLLLIHGTADENVHFQHTLQFIDALNSNNKPYQLYLNPDAGHGTSSKKMRYDLYKMLYEFLQKSL